MDVKQPKVFISYAWNDNKKRIWYLADKLKNAGGVEVVIDKSDLELGADKNKFMERIVTDPSITHVLVFCDRTYTEKANGREGGVGREASLIASLFDKRSQRVKVIPVFLEKDEEGISYCPSMVKHLYGIDFSDPSKTEEKFEELVSSIRDVSKDSLSHSGLTEDKAELDSDAENGMGPVPHGNRRFVGREKELGDLAQLCETGRIPLIHADGGTGKTELALEYGRRYAGKYVGGVFHVRMEGVTDWAAAWRNVGQDYPDCFKRESGEGDERRELSPEEVRRRLVKRTGGKRFLLIFDNVDPEGLVLLHERNIRTGLDGLFAGKFPPNCHALATGRVADGFSPTEKVSPYALDDLPLEMAEKLMRDICSAKTQAEEEAVRGIAELVQGHAWSVEMAASDVAANRDLGMTYGEKLKTLRTIFDPAGESGRAFRKDEHTAAELFRPTKESLCRRTNGEACYRLAQIAALFPADGVCWWALRIVGEKLFADKGEFKKAMAILRRYSIVKFEVDPFQGRFDEHSSVSMHRFTHAALRESLKEEVAQDEVLRQVAEDLREWWWFNGGDWVRLAGQSPLFEYCPFDELDGRNWAELLAKQPQFAEKCAWRKLGGRNWAELLAKQPQLAKHCDWRKLDDGGWGVLLARQPQFTDKLDFAKLTGAGWVELLSHQPQFAEKCGWVKLDGFNWSWLLRERPQLAEHCDWRRLGVFDWHWLLEEQPQLAKYLTKLETDAEVLKQDARLRERWKRERDKKMVSSG